ncbi:MAG: molybdopterin oxidoreductase family protein [Desulfarculus sp.]|nr:molybdopterin oxidoreductase family protein [Desulfarculus sp.]
MESLWPSVCPFDCPDTCGLLVKVRDQRAVAVGGDPGHPFTRGFICQKMRHYPARVHSPARLTQPLLRDGAKGSGAFRPIGWGEALDIIERQINQTVERHGAEAILPYSYAGHMGVVQRQAGDAFFHKLGASRLERTICGTTAGLGFSMSLGRGPSTDIESVVDSDFIIIWGSNTLTTNLHAWPFFSEARRRGARIVVIDPYQNRTARRADQHLMLRPGSDAALALAMMQVLIGEDLLAHDFIARHTLGFEQLRERAQEWPPERAAQVCGLDAQEIAGLARDYGRARAPYIRTGFGFARQVRGGMAMRAVALLPALVGALHQPGGGITRTTSEAAPFNMKALTRPDLAPPGVRSFNMVQLGRALTQAQPPVRLLYVYLCNPAVVAPDTSQVLAGLMRQDLFTVVQEMFLTETACLADLVLPSACSLEMTDLYRAYGHYHVQMAKPVIPPPGQARPLLAVFQELAGRLGFTEPVFRAGEEEIISWLLRTGSPYLEGITLEGLASGRPLRVNAPANPYAAGFLTPSGKVEFYSQALEALGLDPLPAGAPSQDDEGLGRYALQLITPPRHQFLNSTFNEVPALVAQAGPAVILIHPRDAAARGIADGQEVRVFNGRGACVLRVRVSQETRPGVTVAEGLYWGRHTPGGQGINHLTSQDLADLGGSCAFHCNLVEVAPRQ